MRNGAARAWRLPWQCISERWRGVEGEGQLGSGALSWALHAFPMLHPLVILSCPAVNWQF